MEEDGGCVLPCEWCRVLFRAECSGWALCFHAEESGLGLSYCEMIHVWGMCMLRNSENSGVHHWREACVENQQ